ncbi:T6SS immunity protein Tli4 family protein [Cupriavidus sp. BIS7]|uniref:T6SS immunity protein Tli4 family protein n=1 Tax=Cupriavidus sp. BIS7 TaxID=1217718 RepID=UPI0003193EF6|nr:T6SS immunity protein Tli4 family protein [Cupriavidus sp. BIS7]
MKQGWKTIAIGRHLVDMPETAKLIPQWKYNDVPIEFRDDVVTEEDYDDMVAEREQALHAAKHERYDSLFVQRVPHANRGVTLISWPEPSDTYVYRYDTYFRIGTQTVVYTGEVTDDRRTPALSTREKLSQSWRAVDDGTLPEGPGFVARNVMLARTLFNPENWSLAIRLAGKPDAWIEISAYALSAVEPGLRERAGGLLTSLLGSFVGMHQLRNRARPVGPIVADEILVAGNENGKRLYAFKWEAPGKAYSLAEPQLNAEINVIDSAYKTNQESFTSDEEALELWDALVESIRLRPGAV